MCNVMTISQSEICFPSTVESGGALYAMYTRESVVADKTVLSKDRPYPAF